MELSKEPAVIQTDISLNSSSNSIVDKPRSPDSAENDRFAFEKAQFNRPDFTVHRFIYLASKRSNLEQIHSDLRGYLRELQNSMVGLINDDYADFVNLSSKLAALNDSIQKLSSDVNDAWNTFKNSTMPIRKTSEILNKKSTDLRASRVRQISIRNKIFLLSSLEKLADCLSTKPVDISKTWYVKLVHALTAVEFWYSRIPEVEVIPKAAIAKETCFAKARTLIASDLVENLRSDCQFTGLIITSLQIIGHLEYGTKIATELIKKSTESDNKSEVQRLKRFYEKILRLRKRWIDNCRTNGQLIQEVEKFLDDAILKFILAYLDQNIGEFCVPTETELFFESYNATVDFAQNYPYIQQHPDFLKGLNDRFNVNLYVRRVSTLLNEEVMAKTANTRIVWREEAENGRHPLEASNVILQSIKHMFSPSIFLPIVADRFWEATIHLLKKHNEWIDYCLEAEPAKIVDELSGSITVLEKWPDLVILTTGLKKFDSQFSEFCLQTVFKKVEQIGGDVGLFEQFLDEYNEEMKAKRGKICDKILENLLKLSAKKLQAGVGEIPKRYRWTKKPSPTEPSSYIAETMSIQSEFDQITKKREWDAEMTTNMCKELLNGMVSCFLTNAQQVLSSVQLTGSSLQRFKRKGISGMDNMTNGAFGETDEVKISKQLYLDTKEMRVHAENAQANLDALDAFLKQLEPENV